MGSKQQLFGYDRGFYLRGSPLWFDAASKRQLGLVTALAQRAPPCHQRLIASHPLATALLRLRPQQASNILPAPWERWVGLGGYRLQWLPNNAPLGGSSILIEHPDGHILYTGMPRALNQQWPPANIILIDGCALATQPRLPLTQMKQQLTNFVAEVKSAAVVYVDCFELGAYVLQFAQQQKLPLSPDGILAQVLGSQRRRIKQQSPLLTLRLWSRQTSISPIPEALALWAYHRQPMTGEAKMIHLDVAWYAELPQISRLIRQSKPHTLIVVGSSNPLLSQLREKLPQATLLNTLMPTEQLQFAAFTP